MNDLIRKYDVLKICSEQIWNGADDYYSISANQIAKKVKELPTVDAIPIEYIEAWKNMPDTDAYNRASVDWLIRDWRKEHGTD